MSSYPDATPLGRNDYSAFCRGAQAIGARFPKRHKHLVKALSELDTNGHTPYGARAFGTYVTGRGTFKGSKNYG